MTTKIHLARARVKLAAYIAVLEGGLILLIKTGPSPLLFRSDLGIGDSTKVEGVDKFAAFMGSLSTPLLICLAAVAPLAIIFGAGALMIGNKRALTIIASTIGALALAASATGLVN